MPTDGEYARQTFHFILLFVLMHQQYLLYTCLLICQVLCYCSTFYLEISPRCA